MSAAIDIANYLETLGLGTAGTDIFAHSMPDSPNTLICVMTFGSPMPKRAHGKNVSGASGVWGIVENIQIQVRNKSRLSADQTARSVFEALEVAGGFTVDGTEYLFLECTRYPGQLRVDDNDRTVFFLEFRCTSRSGL